MERAVTRNSMPLYVLAVLCGAILLAVAAMLPVQQAHAAQSVKAAVAAADASSVSTGTGQTVKATLKVQARVQGKGWLKKVKAGKVAGTKTKRGLRALKISLTGMQGVSGHIKYKTYDMGKGWGATAKDGKSSGRASRAVRAVKIWLTGSVKKNYDVWYRVYIKGKGWQPWVKNKAKAGITKNGCYISAIKVKLKRAGDLSGDSAKSKLDGIDISSHQWNLDPAKVSADFIIVKATEGTWYKNPYFKKHIDAALASGKLIGAYHFVRKGDAVKQADYFVKQVGPYVGKCALFLDWEDGPYTSERPMSQGTAWAKKFLDRVYKKTGVRPLIYMSQSVTWTSNWSKVSSEYGLWVAQYLNKYYNAKNLGYVTNPTLTSYGYWDAPTIYQYNSRGRISGYSGNLDVNKFYGNAAAWQKMAAKS